MNPIIMHCNYCEQGQSLLQMCQKAVDWGFDGVEFRRRRFNIEESVEGYLRAHTLPLQDSNRRIYAP